MGVREHPWLRRVPLTAQFSRICGLLMWGNGDVSFQGISDLGADRLARMRRCLSVAAVLALGAALAACGTPEVGPKGKTKRNKEYFAESEYGVKASPRVTNLRTRLPRGGGRDMVGNPYKVRGKWYNPKEEPGYRKTGAASWYGDAFHGRLTANGEIYDMTHLTAAHPTMPLPSYARVTNTANGSSVIVRVNDRGPYSNGRIIDLSKRAAEMLDYHHAGVARVQVEYVGRARMDGRDEQYLVASYRPGGKGARPAIDDGLPSGVMIAMNGATPTSKGDRRIAPPQFPSAPAPVAGGGGLHQPPRLSRLRPTPCDRAPRTTSCGFPATRSTAADLSRSTRRRGPRDRRQAASTGPTSRCPACDRCRRRVRDPCPMPTSA